MRNLLALALVGSLATLGSACTAPANDGGSDSGSDSGSDGGSDGGSDITAPATAAEFGARRVQLHCEIAVECGQAPDVPTCLASYDGLVEFEWVQTLAEVASGTLSYNPETARQCLVHLQEQGCWEMGLTAFDDLCRSVFTGALANNGLCILDADCTSRYCDRSLTFGNLCWKGFCAAKPARVPLDGDCSDEPALCADETYCKESTSRCTTPVPLGSACAAEDSCARGADCTARGSTAGTCAAVPADGSPCLMVNEGFGYYSASCASGWCDRSPTTPLCRPSVPVGGTCDPDVDFQCVSWAECVGTTCVARRFAAETCGEVDQPTCFADLHCTGDTCELNRGTACN